MQSHAPILEYRNSATKYILSNDELAPKSLELKIRDLSRILLLSSDQMTLTPILKIYRTIASRCYNKQYASLVSEPHNANHPPAHGTYVSSEQQEAITAPSLPRKDNAQPLHILSLHTFVDSYQCYEVWQDRYSYVSGRKKKIGYD